MVLVRNDQTDVQLEHPSMKPHVVYKSWLSQRRTDTVPLFGLFTAYMNRDVTIQMR